MGNSFVQFMDVPKEMADFARNTVETNGGNLLYGPEARNFLENPPAPPPTMPGVALTHNLPTNTLLPKQGDIQNNFNTSQQYQARFGVSQQHF